MPTYDSPSGVSTPRDYHGHDDYQPYAKSSDTVQMIPLSPRGSSKENTTGANALPQRPKKRLSKWIKFGIPILALIVVIAVAVGVGVGVGVSHRNKSAGGSADGSNGSSSGNHGSNNETSNGNQTTNVPQSILQIASNAAKKGGTDDLTYFGTDLYGNPTFKTNATKAVPSASGSQVGKCAADTFSGSTTQLRSHPRIMTTAAQWSCLPDKIANDAYLTIWNYTIFQNATAFYAMPPQSYDIDGGFAGSGILDPAREVQLRVKTFAYAYHLSGNDTKWAERAWQELLTAAGNNTNVQWGKGAAADRVWNPTHFLDTAELTAAFAIGYDWLYDYWTPDRRSKLAWTMVTQGLIPGHNAYTNSGDGSGYAWWLNTNGNWNCVCNSGLLLGALALGSDDPTGSVAADLISAIIPNMKQNCMQGVYDDGTWSETANYWYFGTNGLARAVSALTTATGSDQGMMASNTNWGLTGYFHMFVSGMAGMFYYGDNGPNKYSTNANGMFLFGSLAKNSLYALFQRDRADAADPLSMFWYDTSSKGAFWNDMPLDRFFDNDLGSWASMRSSWTDFTGTYVAIKSSNGTGHQNHGDLDAGDFVIDALGTRWAGEFGSANYLSTDYFTAESPDAARWKYYRKGTQGQNTIVINKENQSPDCRPVNTMVSTNVTQSSSLDFTPATTDAVYFKTDMSDAYGFSQGSGYIVRGIRMLNGRRQVLVRDEIAASVAINDINWRVHTNATVTLSSDKQTATLTISKLTDPNAWGNTTSPLVASLPKQQTMIVKLLSPSTAQFATTSPDDTRLYGTDPNTVSGQVGDPANTGVTLLYIDLPGGSQTTIETVWQPQWDELTTADKATPKSVSLAQWSLTSHD